MAKFRVHRVLIVDRDAESTRPLQEGLLQAGLVVAFDSGVQALAAIERASPGLVVLDWNLPGIRAPELLRQMQRMVSPARPRTLAVSESCDEERVLSGFELGVDDFVVKPYSVPEVVARVRAILRSIPTPGEQTPNQIMRFRDLRLDAQTGGAMVRGEPVHLRRQEFRLLYLLLERAGRVVPRDQLLNVLWGPDCNAAARAVDVTVQRTRKALMRHGCAEYLQTVRGVGYRLSEPESPEQSLIVPPLDTVSRGVNLRDL